MKHQFFVLIASGLCAQSAFAGGLSDPIIPVLAPPPLIITPLDWYVGLQAGILEGDLVVDAPVGGDGPGDEIALSGPLVGVHAGVQRRFGAITAGVEIDYNTAPEDLEDSGTDIVIDMDTLAHLKLRVGGNVGQTFVYGTAGLAYASLTVDPGGAPVELTDTAPFIGLGADVMVSGSISVGGEVLFHSFENMDDSGADVDFTTAMLRVSYHF